MTGALPMLTATLQAAQSVLTRRASPSSVGAAAATTAVWCTWMHGAGCHPHGRLESVVALRHVQAVLHRRFTKRRHGLVVIGGGDGRLQSSLVIGLALATKGRWCDLLPLRAAVVQKTKFFFSLTQKRYYAP